MAIEPHDFPASMPSAVASSLFPLPSVQTTAAAQHPASPAAMSPPSLLLAGQLSPDSASFLSAASVPPHPRPQIHHRRTSSRQHGVIETLHAKSQRGDDDEDGPARHKINQYTVKTLIGRGSFGDVHLATDQYGTEYAVKMFSKVRLRNQARSSIMRRGPFGGDRAPGGAPGTGWPRGFGAAARLDSQAKAEEKDPLFLIRQEVAIMKKLDHPHLVQLIEVLDDPLEDSLYMVLEMCKRGVIMDVGLGKAAQPYDEKTCRRWFRHLILAIEYLHAQNIIHHDIKPDNLLITADGDLKVADFGVSEMFEKPEGMRTSKMAGAPAFSPPELCISHHGEVSGPPCDIWAMGVTLYCLRYGRVPFDCNNIPEMYEAIVAAEMKLPEGEGTDFIDLMQRICHKDPSQRITMTQLREHPWVTIGEERLPSAEENCANPVEPPNALELSHAFTQKMSHLFCVLKAIKKFKGLLRSQNRGSAVVGSAPLDSGASDLGSQISSMAVTEEGMPTDEEVRRVYAEFENNRKASLHTSMILDIEDEGLSGEEKLVGGGEGGSGSTMGRPTLFLGIGTGGSDDFGLDGEAPPVSFVSESPTAAGFDVYDSAYQKAVDQIRSQRSDSTVYQTRWLEHGGPAPAPNRYIANLQDPAQGAARENTTAAPEGSMASATRTGGSTSMADIVARAMEESRP